MRASAYTLPPSLPLSPAERNVNVERKAAGEGKGRGEERNEEERSLARSTRAECARPSCVGASSFSPDSPSAQTSNFEVACDCLLCVRGVCLSIYRPRAKRSKLNSFVILVCADFHEAGPQNSRGVRHRRHRRRGGDSD